jgi:hypothetical protein
MKRAIDEKHERNLRGKRSGGMWLRRGVNKYKKEVT